MQRRSDLDEAIRILNAGGLVAFPTETVYGLGANASNAAAVRRIFEVKGRPANHPVIVHVHSAQAASQWIRDVPAGAHVLMERLWPGPLTLIFKRAAHVLDAVTGGQDTVGVRVPAHPVAQTLLRAFGGGVAAPSANRFGRISPTRAEHVRDDLGAAVDLILDGGAADVGIESTIVDFSGDVPAVLRLGGVSVPKLEALLGRPLASGLAGSPRASGTLAAHYAPSLPMLLANPDQLDQTIAQHARDRAVGVLSRRARPAVTEAKVWAVASPAAAAYAHDLYASLRELDRSGCDLLIIEAPEPGAQWDAVRDRLQRAAAGSGARGPTGETDDAT